MTVTKISEKQLMANQKNASLSTGPQTGAGKAIANGNAIRHGIFSSQLVLDDEEPDHFQALFAALQNDLRPVGVLELTLVERIAVSIWRQRRLVQAETAKLNLARREEKIADGVNSELGLGRYSGLKAEDLEPFDTDQIQWCGHVIDEGCALEQIDLEDMAAHAPLILAQLKEEAEEDNETIEEFLAAFDNGLTEYIDRLMDWCRGELFKAGRRPEVLAITDQVRAKRLILRQHDMELLARYQTTLDNQLYKTLRAFREAQDWRLKTLDALPDERDMDAEAVA